MTRRKRRLLLTAIVLAPPVALVCAWAFIDAPRPDDADLRITYDDIPDEENAFTYFNRAAEELTWPKGFRSGRDLEDLLEDDGWDARLAAKILMPNKKVFDLIKRGLSSPRFQVPEITGPETLLPYLVPWRDIGRLGVVRAKLLFERDRQREAFEQAIQVARFGVRIQNGHGAWINYCLGNSIRQTALVQFRKMLGTTTLPPEMLAPRIRQLDDLRASPDGFADALRVEYMINCVAVDDFAEGRGDLSDFCGGWAHPSGRYMLFKRNKTKRLLAGVSRLLMPNATRTYTEASFAPYPDWDSRKFKVKAHLSGNGKGLLLYRMLMTPGSRMQMLKCAENCSVAATQIQIALKCYKAEHGDLPDTLDKLVPKYFKTVPLDDFDGKPMKYSKAKRVIYAVGSDLTDDGGKVSGALEWIDVGEGFDLVYKIR